MPTARLPIDAAHRAAASDAHPIGAVTGLTAALAGKAAIAHESALTGVHGIVRSAATSVGLGESTLAANDSGGNVAVGYEALKATAGRAGVTGVGYRAGYANTTGYLTAVGYLAGQSNTTGSLTALGHAAGQSNTTGNLTAVGYAAGQSNTTGNLTAVGYAAGHANTTGYLTAVGYLAGRYLADGTTGNATAAGGTYLGQDTRASAASAGNETVIGYAAIGGGSNTVRLGNASVTNWLPGATNKVYLGNATTALKGIYLSDGTDEWLVTVNTSGALVFAKQA